MAHRETKGSALLYSKQLTFSLNNTFFNKSLGCYKSEVMSYSKSYETHISDPLTKSSPCGNDSILQ